MAMEQKEMVNLLKTEDVKVNILLINGSPRGNNHSQIPLDKAMEAAEKLPGVETDVFAFKGKKIGFCRHCPDYCRTKLECMYKDDFEEYYTKWLWADGVIWVTPVYHMGPPAQVRAVMDRLSEVGFHQARAKLDKTGGKPVYARYAKAMGAIVHGATRFGGQEITLQFLMNYALLMDGFYVTGDMPECYLGAAGHSPNREALLQDESFLHSAATVGKRVTEMAKIIKAAKMLAYDTIPDGFFPSKTEMNICDRQQFVESL